MPPTPETATDDAAFVRELRRLKSWSGLSYRDLERRARDADDVLPASTTATMLGRGSLPRAELLATFVRACGLDADEQRRWLTARAMLADGPAVAERSVVRRRRWSIPVAAAALVVAFAGGAVVTTSFGAVQDVDIVAR